MGVGEEYTEFLERTGRGETRQKATLWKILSRLVVGLLVADGVSDDGIALHCTCECDMLLL